MTLYSFILRGCSRPGCLRDQKAFGLTVRQTARNNLGPGHALCVPWWGWVGSCRFPDVIGLTLRAKK